MGAMIGIVFLDGAKRGITAVRMYQVHTYVQIPKAMSFYLMPLHYFFLESLDLIYARLLS